MYAIVGMWLNAFMQKVSFYKKHGPRWDATQPGHIYSAVGNVSCLTADPGVVSSILVRSHTFLEIGQEIISVVILLHSAESFKMGCCYKRIFLYVHEVLVDRLIKFTQEKVWLDELTIP